MKRWLALLLCSLCLALPMSCTAITDKSLADQVMTDYHNAIKAKDWEGAMNFFSPDFFQQTPRSGWTQTLRDANVKLGDLDSTQQTYWKIQSVAGIPRTGNEFILRYKLEYSNFEAEEEVVLFEPAGSREIKILEYTINSKGFSK